MTVEAQIAAQTGIFAALKSVSGVHSLVQAAGQGGALSVAGTAGSSVTLLASFLRRQLPGHALVLVADTLKSQETLLQDLQTWTGPAEPAPLFFPAWEVLPHESRLPHSDVISERLETLAALGSRDSGSKPGPIVVTSITALLQRTFSPEAISKRSRTLRRGDRWDPLDLVEWLEEQGYEPEAQVTQKGELALRGGIVDIFPPTSPWPVRIEFFGDELESMREFDPSTQISRNEIESALIPPAGELGLLKRMVTDTPESEASLSTLLEYVGGNAVLLLVGPSSIEEHAARYLESLPAKDPFHLTWNELLARWSQPGRCVMLCHDDDMSGEVHADNSGNVALPVPGSTVTVGFQSLETYRPLVTRAPTPQVAETQRREFFGQLHRWLRQGYQVQVCCNNPGEQQRFGEVWKDYGLDSDPSANKALSSRLCPLSRGFISDEAKLVVVTDAEIFGRYKVQRPRRLKSPHAASTRSALDIDFTDLQEGDFVVHLEHGIGRYQGLKTLPSTKSADNKPGGGQECLVIEYAASDPSQPAPRLYVPVTEAHLVSKYVGAGKIRPPLNTLGGNRWTKTKEHAEKAVRDLAAEMLRIQAVRETQAGHAFGLDTPWQREFESAFLYEETPDQMKAIQDAKTDMEGTKPMDRLICGDVGFGKTEVAIRAAFKAVMDGKQVAFLVPTTVLAQQHFNTLRERMADYPVRIELLSRFRTRREQMKTIANLAAGAADIVVGTHRLVQNDVEFKNLGLVVIDEEQRFGVVHKEKFKRMRQLVDVLTLSATPIPRTLYLALTGARDMSTIQTPPHDRLPVETIVIDYDERLIRDAIQRELNRGGQVFFLHNRVTTIDVMAQKIRALVPHARMLVGHGQMDADDLEEVMTKFINGEADVLLSTSIIESGLDIPNANTIIIDRADRFGLSELYQLRGRVGRYKHQAYAYLMLPRHAKLLNDVRKRMSAIKQYSTLGSGFKIAMRDLEIRGAGNLLGSQQSGHITAVGFDLYCQLLKQSVSALKGEKVKPRIETQVRLDFLALHPGEESSPEPVRSRKKPDASETSAASVPREVLTYYSDELSEVGRVEESREPVARIAAYLPLKYIPEPQHRVDIYRKLGQINDEKSLASMKREMRDRFGPLPAPVELIMEIAGLKLLAQERSVTVIAVKEDR
ncbi:MAG TPA: transcription-repair coupling factor, partial [Roseimicrobium sp.]|nr:transcription-repair coupling factor [Roseimicrobium sp.]